ncbi:inovirus-type Gp2 protein [Nitrosomonas oligotropha]|uniref:inovirus-type Gp2 protein n=1 Tax=Nitrosomonas oligotropha TaxID=42354 RepID=UPI00136F3459|nr:inovirus-type Gp2 protein [Nitrosomonas oligotropha]MXS82156.1 inovirus Gp2 family protein [Nitrosomonas oligotropha]
MKKLSNEDKAILFKGLLKFTAPDEETGTWTSDFTGEDVNLFYLLEGLLDTLATKGNGQEFIKKSIVAKCNDKIINRKTYTEYQKYVNSWQGGFVKILPSFAYLVSRLSSEYVFSIHIETFRALCRDRNFSLGDSFLRDFCQNPKFYYSIYGEENGEQARVFINDFFKDLWLRLREPKTRKKVLDARKAGENNKKEYCKYVRNLFAARTPINVIRIDLSYKKDTQIGIKNLIRDIKHLHTNMRHKPKLFKGLLGHVEKIENGLSKGLHVHVLFFFSSERRANADVYLAEQIGRYWVDKITDGKGHYWNVNAYKKQYEDKGILGIGEIHAHDEEAINYLCNNIVSYMCKVEQFIKPAANPKTKLLRRGEMPILTSPKRGRPRNIEQNTNFATI